jgi:O-methyltransferase/methyltransferase family protein
MPDFESPRARLLKLIVAFRQTQCIRVAVEFGVADQLASGPATSAELATACGAEEPFLRRLLRALTGLGLLDQDDDGRYRLTEVGEQMRVDRLGPAALFFGGDPIWSAWGALDHAVRTGEHPFDHVHGMDVWEYYAAHPDEGSRFDAAMASITGGLADAVVSSYDFSGFRRVVDVGGGDGTLLSAILRSAPSARGVLFDVPAVVERAKQALESAGVLDRSEPVGGDFRAAVPDGADCYVLKWILHDWEDDVCTTILRRCREAVTSADGAKLVVIERVLPERVGPEHLDLVLSDLNMMATTRGRERTKAEFAELFAGAGFRLDRVVPTGTNVSVVEATPVPV